MSTQPDRQLIIGVRPTADGVRLADRLSEKADAGGDFEIRLDDTDQAMPLLLVPPRR